MHTFQILHISDLHISTSNDFERSVVLDPLLKRIGKDFESGIRPEIVVVTGDLAHSGLEDEYKTAKVFFDELLKKLGLDNDRIFIVPGNHDVNRKKYRPGDIPAYKTMSELDKELEDYRADLLKGMNGFFDFIETHYAHLKSIHERLIPFVYSYTSQSGKKIALVGLNSAWMCRKSPDRNGIAIGEYQINNAVKELNNMGAHDLVINIFHHPLDWLWSVDRKICKGCLTHSIVLSGHIHDAEARCGKDLDCEICEFHAGASYEGSEAPAYNSFQYITVDFETQKIRLDFRKYDIAGRKWTLAGEKGDDGTKTFDITWTGRKDMAIPVSIPEISETYKEWLTDRCGRMDIEKLAEKERVIKVRLPEIFVPLYAYPAGRLLEEKEAKKLRPAMEREFADMHEERKPADIEDLVAKNEHLLIEGEPGSGKTTLFKHLAFTIIKEINEKGLNDFLPVLIYLKDLKTFFEMNKSCAASPSTAEAILDYYCRDGLDLKTIKRYCKAGKAMFLLDGLDEIQPRYRKVVVNSFKDFGIQHKGNKVVLSGRPHGIDTAVTERFGEYHIKILTLNMDQVELFVKKWFDYVYQEGSITGGRTAAQMIGEVKGHPGVSQLIETPLMLTAVCILYHDGKELPGQRAELYKKFIGNLLYRRFDEPERVHNFLKNLAFEMHSKRERGIDRRHAVQALERVFYPDGKASREESEELFDRIEYDCGLLKLEDGRHTFRHLTFQEFLTASYIIDKETDYAGAIQEYWNNDWYKEVIELYIGLLSIENIGWANKIVGNVLRKKETKPFNKWRLASRCILDIHKDRRDNAVLDTAKKRLMSIIHSDARPVVRVDAGETLGWLGDPREDLKSFVTVIEGDYELSLGRVHIAPFAIGKYPVTNSWFEEFINAEGYKNKVYWSDEGWKWLEHTKAAQPWLWDDRKWRCPNSPVVGVCWYEAYAFAKWLTSDSKYSEGGKYKYTLPDENQWEAAAAGFEKREYPWGKWVNDRCNSRETEISKTSPVGIFYKGNTPEGVVDMSGNVWEWTTSDSRSKEKSSDFKFDEERVRVMSKEGVFPVLRGSSWGNHHVDARCASRFKLLPDVGFDFIGFRCARTIKK